MNPHKRWLKWPAWLGPAWICCHVVWPAWQSGKFCHLNTVWIADDSRKRNGSSSNNTSNGSSNNNYARTNYNDNIATMTMPGRINSHLWHLKADTRHLHSNTRIQTYTNTHTDTQTETSTVKDTCSGVFPCGLMLLLLLLLVSCCCCCWCCASIACNTATITTTTTMRSCGSLPRLQLSVKLSILHSTVTTTVRNRMHCDNW